MMSFLKKLFDGLDLWFFKLRMRGRLRRMKRCVRFLTSSEIDCLVKDGYVDEGSNVIGRYLKSEIDLNDAIKELFILEG